MSELLDDLRIRIRRWLGVSDFQKRTRDRLKSLEDDMAISQEDLGRLNAATSRIAARVTALLDQIDALGTGNDDEVRAQQQQADLAQASADLRPVMEQLELLGADAAQPVPTPDPNQVPVEPGPDVSPVTNTGDAGDGTVVTNPPPAPGEAPSDTTTVPDAPATPVPGTNPDGDTRFDDSGIATGEPAPVTPVIGDGSGASQPGPSGDEAAPTSGSNG